MRKAEKLEKKRRARDRAIDGLVAQARLSGGCEDRMYWTLVWDLEMAPMTTNAQQLAEIGFRPPLLEEIEAGEVRSALHELIEELASLGVYLLHTDHLSDGELYATLVSKVLHEPVRDLPPSPDVVEWLDLAVGVLPDGGDVYLSIYATDDERRVVSQARSGRNGGGRSARSIPPRRERLVDRDRWLPRPEGRGAPEPGVSDAGVREPF